MSGIGTERASFLAYSRASLVLLPFLGIALPATSSSAQVISAGDGTETIIDTMDSQINITGGQTSGDGANLFHSFEQFDLSAEQTANFETIPNVQNVVGKVGGARASVIDGTLQVSGSEANLYLMNPAGILIGPDAQLNLSGGFTATTATGIGFENGQFAFESDDYSELTGEPTTFQFVNDRAGAVVNLGDLSVNPGESIGLIGGSTVNAGKLSAPEGTVTIAAVEGNQLVRISQGDQLLSLEVEPIQGMRGVQPQSIGSMLTGSGLGDATALITEADGTVRLRNVTIDEEGGSAIATNSISTTGITGGNINILGNEVSLLNAELNASGTQGGGVIRVGGDYRGEGSVFNARTTLVDSDSVLSANAIQNGEGGRAIVWADDNTDFYGQIAARGGELGGNGGFAEVSGKQRLNFRGSTDLTASRGELGTLLLDPEEWIVTDGPVPAGSNTTAISYMSSEKLEEEAESSNVYLEATNGITIENLSDDELDLGEDRFVTFRAGAGRFSMDSSDTIRAERGRVEIRGAGITVGDIDTSTQSSTKDNPNRAAGDIILNSTQDVIAGDLWTFGLHKHGGGRSPHGGRVLVRAGNGDLTAGDIFSYSDGDHDEAGRGGAVDLTASGKIATQTIDASSQITVFDDDLRSADTAGAVDISSGNGIFVNGDIDASSRAVENVASDGGDVSLFAASGSIEVTGDTFSFSSGRKGAGDAGLIFIKASTIKVDGLDSRAESEAGPSGNSSSIELIGDTIEFGEGADSVAGSFFFLKPITPFRQVSIGTHDSSALSITDEEIASIGNNVQSILIGESGGTIGDVQLGSSVTSANAASRARILILDGETLIGSDEDTLYDILGEQAGSIIGSGDALTTFSGISAIQGGVGDDRFRISPNVSNTDLLLYGGAGNNVLDYTQFDDGVMLSVEGLSNLKVQASTALGQSNTLSGIDGDSRWRISGADAGYVVSSAGSVEFEGFGNLIGGLAQDEFAFERAGSLSGQIVGGGDEDTLSYALFDSAAVVDLEAQQSTATGFSGIENFVGNDREGSAIRGFSGDDEFVITGDRAGSINGQFLFSEFSTLDGVAGNDKIRLDGVVAENDNRWGTDGNNSGEINSLQFQNISMLFGSDISDSIDTLYSSDENVRFEIQEDGSIKTGELTFFEIDAVSGDEENAVLDYSRFTTPIRINLEDSRVVGGLSFRNTSQIVGSAGSTVFGTAGDDRFEILGDRELSANGLLLSQFSAVNGGTGNNTFLVNEASASNIQIKGGSDDLSFQNSVISDIANANWWLSNGKNQGRLESEEGTVLAEFSQIQRLENNTTGSLHSITFSGPMSQITGAISSGNSDLVLVGDDISIGNNYGNDNIVGAEISGTGTLTIRPETSGVDIELGGRDSRSAALSITNGEIEAIQDSFSQVIIGDSVRTGDLIVRDGVSFGSAVALQASGEIEAKGRRISAEGSVLVEGDRIAVGTINSREGVSLLAQQNVSVDSVLARGQGIEIESLTGRIMAGGALTVSGQQVGSGIRLSAPVGVVVGELKTDGGEGSGGIDIFSDEGGITTAGVSTSSPTDSMSLNTPQLSAVSGRITLEAQEDIEVEFLDARGEGKRSGESGFITIETAENFMATGYLSGTTNSISTAGVENGTIDITYGNENRPEQPFLVGQTSENGTVGGISADLEIVSGDVPSGISKGNITVVDRGYQLAEPREPVAPLEIVEPLAEQASSIPEIKISSGSSSSSQETLRSLESGIGEAFKDYLNLPEGSTAQQAVTLVGMQETLEEVEQRTEITPALVYVYFVPDASLESSVVSNREHEPQEADQLEVMLITSTGEPIRKRQWGVTRTQVEAASRELRMRVTSQFTTAKQYLAPAHQLYDWIVRPIAKDLVEQQVESIGFVMDTGLRTMPISTLHDGDRYLVENYSLGLMPTFSLTEFKTAETEHVDLTAARVLAMGASEFADQPDLPAVGAEVDLIARQLWEGDSFLNEDFVLENLQQQIKGNDYGVVHLATHASFESGNSENSYIQMWDRKLALNDVGKLGLDESDVGLIILSACNTALGDRASEYGFAGFAVTAGSQSALASIWPVNDEGTLGFMSQFYQQLKQAPVRTEALRQAQISLIRGEVGIDDGVIYGAGKEALATLPSLAESGRWDFSHPFFWSAFTMIGNPW